MAADKRNGHALSVTHVVLFVFTCLSTLVAGALMEGAVPWREPAAIVKGIPFSLTLMLILLTHEMGHYTMSRRHGTPATLPYFIPAPSFIGTFGAVIKMRPPIMTRRALLDIGATGPLAGLVVAVAAVLIGLPLSDVRPLGMLPEGSITLGDSLLFKFLALLSLGIDPSKAEIVLHPVAFAGWIGLFITSLNLIPIGQLDGGHIVYALFPEYHRIVSRLAIPVLLVMGLVAWPGWALWGVLMLILGTRHPPVEVPHVELDPLRTRIGWVSLAVFFLTFTPTPFSGL